MRSADAHALLAAHDPALPALPALLDGAVLGERLGAPATRSYLRYKPGTSATALVEVDGRRAIAQVWASASGAKRGKALKYAHAGDVLLDVPEEGLLVVDALADRHLPALRLLVRSGRVGPWLSSAGHPAAADGIPQTLSHKPARRWVGRLPLARSGESVVLRAYTPRGYDSALAAHGLLDPARCPSIRLPRVLGTHRRGLIALEHLPGRALDESVPDATLHRLGAFLGELHVSGPVGRAGATHPGTTEGLEALGPVLGELLPEADAVGAAGRAALRPGPGSVIHGDFSLDQVVAEGHDLGVIDLDRVRFGNPLDDIASLLAAATPTALRTGGADRAAALIERLRTPLVAGHASTWTGKTSDDLGPRIALELLSRAGEPFRTGCPEWPEVTRELITLAGSLAAGRIAA